MSHDRGCWKCGRDIWEYEDCNYNDCALKICLRSIKENAAVSKTADDGSNPSEDTTNTINRSKKLTPEENSYVWLLD